VKKQPPTDLLSDEATSLLNHAITLGETPDYQQGIDILLTLYNLYKQDFSVCFFLGKLYYEHHLLKPAALFFAKATRLRPAHELCSIALFHCRMGLKRRKTAFAEVDRYLSVYPPKKMYTILLEECLEQIELDADLETLGYAERIVLKHYRRYYVGGQAPASLDQPTGRVP
jgi:hypothetical protein